MLDRMQQGSIPAKHHIRHPNPAGGLYWEECLTTRGFEGPYTIMYHQNRPHEHILCEDKHGWEVGVAIPQEQLKKEHYKTQDLPRSGGCPLSNRTSIMLNEDIEILVLHPDTEDTIYFNNGDSDELFYIFEGSGTVRTSLGDLQFKQDDYVYIPKGVLHRFIPDVGTPQYWLNIQCHKGMDLLKQWRNHTGQLRMDAPYCHRDFQRPSLNIQDEGIRTVVVKRNNRFQTFKMPNNPLDVVGWDGTVYPWIFPILNFQPRAGLVHLPPTWHGTFATSNSLICSFVPRAVDFHKDAIPCPYPHSSVDCDEFLFYCRGNFTSRKGVGPGSVSYHPMGIPHGPHPGAYEASIGHRETTEMAVMIDTYRPLHRTKAALAIEDPNYQQSFLE